MVSLLHLAEITEEGVTFQSPVDGSQMLLTPEESIGIQNRLGACVRGWGAAQGVRAMRRACLWLDKPLTHFTLLVCR